MKRDYEGLVWAVFFGLWVLGIGAFFVVMGLNGWRV